MAPATATPLGANAKSLPFSKYESVEAGASPAGAGRRDAYSTGRGFERDFAIALNPARTPLDSAERMRLRWRGPGGTWVRLGP